MLASRFAHTKVVCLLLENRADPNSTSFDGHTALMLGNSNRLAGSEVARLLLQSSAEIMCVNAYGDTVFDILMWRLLKVKADLKALRAALLP